MVTTPTMTHTLVGNIYEAQPGNHTIITTNDHSVQLCPIRQNSINIIENTSSSSSSLTTGCSSNEEIHNILPTNSDTNPQIKLKSNCIQLFDKKYVTNETILEKYISYCILQISGCKITIDRPYNGPIIKNSEPKIFLRTNLIPSSNSAIKNKLSQKLKIENDSKILGKIQLPKPFQTIRSHPLLPYIFIGNNDNTISIITPESYL